MHLSDSDVARRREAALAWACDHAGCTQAQAGALRLLAQGKRVKQIARLRGIPFRSVQRALLEGRNRLEEAFSHLIEAEVRWWALVLACARNHRDCRPAPVLTYAKVPGGYDPTPVTVRARPHGSVAEDLIDDDGDFLRALAALLS